MKLTFSYQELSKQLDVTLPNSNRVIRSVAFDTRRIVGGEDVLFFALKGEFRDGHEFIQAAYEKGVRTFVVSQKMDASAFEDATFILVDDTLKALQSLAKSHRKKFDIPVVGITGSAGKTIVKEWLGQLLEQQYRVVRSPKSYNSQLGVALSLLEIHEDCDLALIEAGISGPGDMETLADMIQPTHGIFTSLGSAHKQNFESKDAHMAEKLRLFDTCEKVFVHHSIPVDTNDPKMKVVHEKSYASLLELLPFEDEISRHNAAMAIVASRHFELDDAVIERVLPKLDRIALRLETFDGINNCLIINDTYNLDLDALRSSLEYQLSVAQGRNRAVIIGTKDDQEEIKRVLQDFEPIEYHFVSSVDDELPEFSNSVILIKGRREMRLEQLALRLRERKHQTYVEVNLSAIRNNLAYCKSKLDKDTKVLAMVKASSYGSGIDEMGVYLERIGVNYLGVAYADEGVQLRKAGVQLPVLVMNTEEGAFEDCIAYDLEPCIYSTEQLNAFILQLIYVGKTYYPVHITLETGMNRLGFETESIPELLRMLQTQPEVRVKSIYSHLATADEIGSEFVKEQVQKFERNSEEILKHLPYDVDRHIANSEGVLHYPQYQFDMVRIGIAMYGYATEKEDREHLQEAIRWFSAISQIRSVEAGKSIGYGRAGVAEKSTRIAVIPLGYGDGFRRSLSGGKGQVIIHGQPCPVIGNVCMDMTMIDIGDLPAEVGDPVEIIGDSLSLMTLAEQMDTIPYEVLTGISRRVQRLYVED
ncbi:MAG: alanine racemase [Fluviicola sp. XM-24bin1]|nr:MAG: alanine racemase [Fluviicola sp. XM-24bin1]